MRLLFVTSDVPCSTSGGYPTRNYHLIKEAAERHDVELLTFVPPGQDGLLEPLRGLCRDVLAVGPDWTLPGYSGSRWAGLLRDLTTEPPPVISMCRRFREESRAHLQRLLARGVDIVQLEGSHLEHLLPEVPVDTRIVVDLHNVESHNQWLAMRYSQRWVDKARGLAAWWKLRHIEAGVFARAHCSLAMSEVEKLRAQRLSPTASLAVAPNGVDIGYFQPGAVAADPALVFTGSMSYGPNVDAVEFFADRILPGLRAVRPDLAFRVVGRNPAPHLVELGRNVGFEVTGAVDDVRPYLHGASVIVVPLRFGAGTRLKILEAMACGKAVVSTAVGAEGLAVTHGQDIVLADTPTDFVRQVSRLLQDPSERERIGMAARQTVEATYSWGHIAREIDLVYASLVAVRPRAGRA